MHSSARGSSRRRAHRGTRLVIALAVLLVLGYGFYIQTTDFHKDAGFQSHRKVLRETELAFMEASEKTQKEAEELSIAASRGKITSISQETPYQTVQAPQQTPKSEGVLASKAKAIAEAVQQHADELDSLISAGTQLVKENSMQDLVQQQELKLEGQATFTPLQPIPRGEENPAGGVHKLGGALLKGSSESVTPEEEWRERQKAVKQATKETWAAYERHSMGSDELRPLSLQGKTVFGDLGATLVDSLDTLWMMGLKEEFSRARIWVSEQLNFTKPAKLSLFETNIRIVGGLLSAYDLTEDKMFLDKAQKLVDMLMPVFETTATGIPNNIVYINQGNNKTMRPSQLGRAALAEFGTLQLEFVALSQRTANATYGEKAEAIVKHLHKIYPEKGLLPVWFNRRLGKASGSNLYTIGAMADSYYEYLLKLWLFHQKQEEMYRSMWERATDETLEQLVAISPTGLTFVGQKRNNGRLVGKMEHLACYFPGSLALGAAEGAVSGAKAQHYLEVAANLTYTCWQMYERTASGLGMDHVLFDAKGDMQPKGQNNALRPETIESFFYMWRVTGDPKYREWGWEMFQAFQRHSRAPSGAFATVKNVNVVPAEQMDGMESFWLAETLKYLWLLFGPNELLSLEDWVLNTEAHPFRIALSAQQH